MARGQCRIHETAKACHFIIDDMTACESCLLFLCCTKLQFSCLISVMALPSWSPKLVSELVTSKGVVFLPRCLCVYMCAHACKYSICVCVCMCVMCCSCLCRTVFPTHSGTATHNCGTHREPFTILAQTHTPKIVPQTDKLITQTRNFGTYRGRYPLTIMVHRKGGGGGERQREGQRQKRRTVGTYKHL